MTTPRVAVVGAGPAGAYAVGRLLENGPVEIEVFDRLPTPGGLVRAGVAPDHPETKQVERTFAWWLSQPGVRLHLGVEVGRDVTVAELASLHDAVVLTHGASKGRSLGLPGEELGGSVSATDFVGWYNGHPDYAHLSFDLSCERAVVIGNGNVALDVARVLTLGVEALSRTDIADHALRALEASAVREVVVLGRRGPAEAAFTTPELLSLVDLDIDVVVEVPGGIDACVVPSELSPAAAFGARRKLEVLGELAARPQRNAPRRIVLRFLTAPVAIEGDALTEGLRVSDDSVIETGLVIRSVGYSGTPLEGVPFDDSLGRIPHRGGRVLDGDSPVAGLYVAGWIKRGPSGVIGTNKRCAHETIDALLSDLVDGKLAKPVGAAAELDALLDERRPQALGIDGWRAIDQHERAAGSAQQRPRVKVCTLEALEGLAR